MCACRVFTVYGGYVVWNLIHPITPSSHHGPSGSCCQTRGARCGGNTAVWIAQDSWLFKLCIQGFDNCQILGSDSSSAIHTGMGAGNTIEVRAVGTRFTLLVNGQQVRQGNDSSLASGVCGWTQAVSPSVYLLGSVDI